MVTVEIQVLNDPSVGIPDETYIIEHMHFEDAEHQAFAMNVLRDAFREITGESRVRVNVHPET
jgi:hypothetical protein